MDKGQLQGINRRDSDRGKKCFTDSCLGLLSGFRWKFYILHSAPSERAVRGVGSLVSVDAQILLLVVNTWCSLWGTATILTSVPPSVPGAPHRQTSRDLVLLCPFKVEQHRAGKIVYIGRNTWLGTSVCSERACGRDTRVSGSWSLQAIRRSVAHAVDKLHDIVNRGKAWMLLTP